jgi:hypothetical protein
MDGTGVLLTVGVKLGTGVSVDAMGVNAGVGCGENVLQDEMTSIILVRTSGINFVLENVLMVQFAPHCFSGSAGQQPGEAFPAVFMALFSML